MTPYEEKKLFRELRELRSQLVELKEMVSPYVPKEDKFLNTEEAAKELGWSVRKLRYKLSKGELPFATKPDGERWKYSRNAIIRYLGTL